jgi:RNA polymerase sigma-70 factor, ECF subfamily
MTEREAEIKHIEDSKRDPRCFEPLYRRHYEPILKFVYKRMENIDDTRELTSRVFSKAILNIRKYKDHGFPFSSWLYRIAINEVTQFYRDRTRSRVISTNDKYLKNLADDTGEQKAENIIMLKTALQYLTPDELMLIELRYFEEKPFSEIGEILEITENNAKVKTYRIIDKLKEIYHKL